MTIGFNISAIGFYVMLATVLFSACAYVVLDILRVDFPVSAIFKGGLFVVMSLAGISAPLVFTGLALSVLFGN